MCDYSLHNVASTPAKVGDKLVTTSFAMSGSRGFSAIGQPNVAVCVPPGAEIAFDNDVEIDRALGILPRRKVHQRLARFRQINLDQPYAYHDALEFPDGTVSLLNNLAVGQTATVLQLPAQPKPEDAGKPGAAAHAAQPAASPAMPAATPQPALLRTATASPGSLPVG
jgi:hypothetical protein